MRGRLIIGFLFASGIATVPAVAAAQEGTAAAGPPEAAIATRGTTTQLRAIRLESEPVRLDGRLDDAAWAGAEWVSDFVQREPTEGAPPSARTEVAFLYDGEALYVGARMRSEHPDGVRALVTRRDKESTSEQLIVSLDTYHDRRTAYSFGITAAGVRIDYFHPEDRQSKRDYSFDPVWEAKTAVDAEGWTAELRIPFSQLRFNRCRVGAANECVWGVNLTRLIPALNEQDYLVLVRRTETGWASRFAELVGIERSRATRRVELVPYVASQAKILGDPDPNNPFLRRQQLDRSVGADLKVGLGSALTLDATVNPDFAQVEADPAEVNLTAFETVFDERRPFFVEGSQLFKAGDLTFFHSRRIGQAPRGKASGDYAEKIASTTVRGAAKITGRLPSGLSVGILGAVTGPEWARSYARSTGAFGETKVEPLTTFGVVRLQQELGRSRSTAGIILTTVDRDLAGTPALAHLLPQRANAGALDWNLRFDGGAYVLSGALGFSYLTGDSAAMRRVQTSSAHYFQRPDATPVKLDPRRTSLPGYYAGATLQKYTGHWLWNASAYGETPGLEINDAGKLSAADNLGAGAGLSYRQTTPGRYLRWWEVGAEAYEEWDYDYVRQLDYVSVFNNITWPNYWTSGITVGHESPVLRDDLTRGGPLMGRPRRWSVGLSLANSAARKTRWKSYGSYTGDAAGGWYTTGGVGLSVRPGTRWELSADPYYGRGVASRQYFTSLGGGPPATYGRRYVFAFADLSELSVQLRLDYALGPDLTLEGYAEPFASSGRFHRFGELPAARSRDIRMYGTDGTTLTRFGNDSVVVTDGATRFALPSQDFEVLSFRSNLVLRWEWRAGSTAYLVWQQNRGAQDPVARLVRPAALWDALSATGDNFIAVKVSYWLSMR